MLHERARRIDHMVVARRADGQRLALVLALGACCWQSGSVAQNQPESGKWYYGAFSVEPSLRTELVYDDNFFFTPENTVDTRILRVAPSVEGEYVQPGRVYNLRYQGDYGRIQESSADNYEDHLFGAGANIDLAHRHKLILNGEFALKHQGRGEGTTQGFDPETGEIPGFDPDSDTVNEPDLFKVAKLGGDYYFGAWKSGNRLKLSASTRNTTYRNHRSRTRYRDHDNLQAGVTFYHQVLPATSLLLEVRGNDISYDDTFPETASLNSREIRYLVGASWEMTGLTTGTVKVGQVEKNFLDGQRKDFSGFDWEADVSWSPRSYSEFEVSAARSEEETFNDGDFIDTMTYSLGWSHDWTDLLQSRFSVSYRDETYHGIERDQDTVDYSVSLMYQWRRWLALELGADYSDSDSNVDWLMYDKNMIRIGATLTL